VSAHVDELFVGSLEELQEVVHAVGPTPEEDDAGLHVVCGDPFHAVERGRCVLARRHPKGVDAVEFKPACDCTPESVSAHYEELRRYLFKPGENGAGPEPLATDNDKPTGDVEAIKRAIFDDGQIVGQSGQERQEPVSGTGELLYRGASVMIFGPRESGKSWVMQVLAIRAANAGERVLYLDLENGEAIMRERTEAILDANPEWPDPIASDALTIVSFPTLSRSWKPDDWAAALGDYSLVIFDPLHRMLEMHGLEEKDGFGSLAGTRIAPLRARGITVLMGDNVGHEHHDRPRGDSRKEDNVPQVYKCTTAEPFDQVRVGRVRLVCRRSRFGDLNREWEARMGGEVFELPTTVTESPKKRAAKRAVEREENFRRVVIEVLKEKAPLGRDRLLQAVRDRGVKTREAKAREWLSKLVADSARGVVHSEQRGYELGVDPRGGPEGWTRPLRRNDVGGSAATPSEACSCRLPARSPRAGGPDLCQTCKRPIVEAA
jgi:hypothetical protein